MIGTILVISVIAVGIGIIVKVLNGGGI